MTWHYLSQQLCYSVFYIIFNLYFTGFSFHKIHGSRSVFYKLLASDTPARALHAIMAENGRIGPFCRALFFNPLGTFPETQAPNGISAGRSCQEDSLCRSGARLRALSTLFLPKSARERAMRPFRGISCHAKGHPQSAAFPFTTLDGSSQFKAPNKNGT